MQERLEVVHFPLNTTNATSKSKSFMLHANKVPIFWGSVPTYVISGPKRTIQEAEIDPWLSFSFSSFCYFTLVDFSVSFVLLLFLLSLFPCFFSFPQGFLRVESSPPPVLHSSSLCPIVNKREWPVTLPQAEGAVKGFQFGSPCSSMSRCSEGKWMRNRG